MASPFLFLKVFMTAVSIDAGTNFKTVTGRDRATNVTENKIKGITMELKELLGDLLTPEITAKIGERKIVIDDGTLIPKYRFDEVNLFKKSLEDQIVQNEKDLKELKKAAVGNTELVAQIETLQQNNKDLKTQNENHELEIKKTFAIKESLLDAGVGDPAARDLLSKNFDVNKIELDENAKVKGFADLLKPIKENKSFAGMFGAVKMGGQEHRQGELDLSLGEWATKNPFSKKTRNIADQIRLTKENPELAKKLELAAE